MTKNSTAPSTAKRRIRINNYDADWPVAFAIEAYTLYHHLGQPVLALHHVGSTAVPGLAAKPTIDIILAVQNVTELTSYDSVMVALGYTVKGEFGLPGRRFYVKGSPDPTFHVHAYTSGSTEITRHLAFRDYLIDHPDVASNYATLKRQCAEKCQHDIGIYTAGKNEFIKHHEKRALDL